MTIDYTRRARPAPAPTPVPVPAGGAPVPAPAPVVDAPAPAPVPRPVPRPDPEPRPRRVPRALVWAVRAGTAYLAVTAYGNGAALGVAVWAVVLLLTLPAMRQAVRYCLAVAGLAVIRAAAVKGGALTDPGEVTDPDAQWRRWLDARCAGCGY